MDPQAWAERKRAGAEEAWAAAQEALAQVRSLSVAGKTADAQRAALTMAILTDKSGVLEEAARREEERLVRIAEEQAQLLVAVIRVYFGAVGLTLGPAASRPSPTCSARPRMALRRRRRPRRRRRGQRSGARSAAGWTLGRRCCRRGRGRAAG
jgi:hypothetical protein